MNERKKRKEKQRELGLRWKRCIHSRSDHPSMYYAGGLRVLALKIKDISTSTLFRTKGGFDLFADSHVKISAIMTKELKELQREELDFLDAVFDLMIRVCVGNVENQRRLCGLDNVVQSLFRVLQVSSCQWIRFFGILIVFMFRSYLSIFTNQCNMSLR